MTQCAEQVKPPQPSTIFDMQSEIYITEVERIQKQCRFATPVSYNYNPETKRGASRPQEIAKQRSCPLQL